MQRMENSQVAEELSIEQWIRLNAIKGIGPATLTKLRSKNVSLLHIVEGHKDYIRSLAITPQLQENMLNPDQRQISDDLNWLQASPLHQVITRSDPLYPESLAQICNAPILLYCEGNVSCLSDITLGIVGSRACTSQGKRVARSLSSELVQHGWSIASGLALGVDTYAHEGCLESGGTTVAVLGNGLSHYYPRRNTNLRQNIVQQGGCIVSEFAVTKMPKPEHFPRRNRIISGLSKGVLVIEAAEKSGSLITARYALEQNREVFAVPGNIYNPLSKGCHQLIKNGAKLVNCVEDINEEFSFSLQSVASNNEKITEKNPEQGLASDRLLASVDYEATCLDVVVQRSRLPVSEVTAKLLEYELRGLVASVPGGYIRLGE